MNLYADYKYKMNKPVKPEAKRFLQFQIVVRNSKNSLTTLMGLNRKLS